jgi:hypothetical protein
MFPDDTTSETPIPKHFLCRRCRKTGTHLTADGLVDCQSAGGVVAPISRSDYGRFEDCPHRSAMLPGYKLRLLATLARRARMNKLPSEIAMSRVESAEAIIRLDLSIAQQIARRTQ